MTQPTGSFPPGSGRRRRTDPGRSHSGVALLREAEQALTAMLIDRLGVPDTAAASTAAAMAAWLRQQYGGLTVQIPARDWQSLWSEIDERNAAIWADFRPYNQAELALKYGLSKSHIFRILRTMAERGGPR